MSDKNPKIYIIGAGMAGLTAALHLEGYGYAPTILEASQDIGGRVATDIIGGYQLDRGFQVLLDGYPMAQKYLNYDDLSLQKLMPGAMLYERGKGSLFGDPVRDLSFFVPTLTSKKATLRDKLKIYHLSQVLKSKSLESIFAEKEVDTMAYLQDKGFSQTVLTHFFTPFFAGIYLEPDLRTSSSMFEFVYKMFAEGNACIPLEGIGAMPKQLEGQLKRTDIRLETPVSSVSKNTVTLRSGETLNADFTIIATAPDELVPGLKKPTAWKSCDTLYFKTPERTLQPPVIGLNSRKDSMVNNIFFPTSIQCAQRGEEELLSVTVIKDHKMTDTALQEQVEADLKTDFGITNVSFLKHYKLKQSLPDLSGLTYEQNVRNEWVNENMVMAGDQQLYGSLNAAFQSGEDAAAVVHHVLKDKNDLL